MKMFARHMLQGSEWSNFQKALGKQVIEEHGTSWSFTAVVEKGFGKVGGQFSRLYVQYGPYADTKKHLKDALSALETVAVKHGVDYVRIEHILADMSIVDLTSLGYIKQTRTFQPEHTNWVDIDHSIDEIIASLNATNRTAWRNAEKRGQSFEIVHSEEEIADFLHMMKITAERTGSVFRDDSYLRTLIRTLGGQKAAGVIYVSFEGKRIASALYVDDIEGSTRYYMYAGTEEEARKQGANGTLVSYLILQAHDVGLKRVDLFGVTAPDAAENHAWAGFSKFKRSYGGTDVAFNGTWEKPINKQRYFIMKLARMLVNKR
jgi:lipid II:glycine glycyltransferase (peptidoglycan interpeptide bridge formation enzyme)